MKALLNDLSQCLRSRNLGATWIVSWMLLSAALVMALYLTIVCNLNFVLLLTIDTSLPVEAYFWVLTSAVVALLATIVVTGLMATHELDSVDRNLRHALDSVREGELSTRLDLGKFEGCERLEQAFNDAMEVIEHRIENSQAC